MSTTPDHARDYLHDRGVTDEQILAYEARNDQNGAWVRRAAELSMQIRELVDRGDQEGVAEAQTYVTLLQEHIRSELDLPEGGRAWATLHLILSQAATLARDLRGAQAQLAARDADDQLRSIEGRTDYDYQQRILALQAQLPAASPGVESAQRRFHIAALHLAVGADVADRLANDPDFAGDRSEWAAGRRAETHAHDLRRFRDAEVALDAAQRAASDTRRAATDEQEATS